MKSLSEDEALNVGTKILGESLVYGISASFLLYEYNKSHIKDKERMHNIEQLQNNIDENKKITETEIECMKSEIVELKKTVLMDVGRNDPDRPNVDMLVGLFLFLLLSICLHFSK